MRLTKLIAMMSISAIAILKGYAQEPLTKVLQIGDAAPKLQVAKWIRGEKIETFQPGRIYVLEFWATWCKPCIAGMPHLSVLANKYKEDVEVIAVSVMERKDTDLAVIEKFVKSMGSKMDFKVAAEKDRYMTTNWLHAAGERAIPNAIVVDKEGKIAWIGHTSKLDRVLPEISAGKWDLTVARTERTDKQLLAKQDIATIELINPYMGNPGDPEGALAKIATLVKANPKLKYAPKVGNFTFWSLVKTDPLKALEYGRAWLSANDEPSYSVITDAIYGRKGLPSALYVFAADAYQAQLDKYPWSMDFQATYRSMAALYELAGEKEKATDLIIKAETIKKETRTEN